MQLFLLTLEHEVEKQADNKYHQNFQNWIDRMQIHSVLTVITEI
jgi:hypothetical protein